MKKWIIRIVILLIVLSISGFFLAKSYLTRDYLVAAIEKSINSRIQIKDMNVNLYGFSGTVALKNVIIAQRDDIAEQRIPHDQRDLIEKGDVILESVTFNISIWEVIFRKILVERIDFDSVTINSTLYESGDTSIQKLFAKPLSDKGDSENHQTFNAKENEKFITTINEINISNLDINLIIEKSKLAVKGRGINVNLLDINVNPKQLDSINNATIKVNGTFDLESLDSTIEYGKIITSGESNFSLFNNDNGDLEPDMIISLTVDSDSYLTNQVPALSKIAKASEILTKFGIKSFEIPDKAKFKNDQSVRVSYKLGVSALLDPLIIKVFDWELEATSQSWLNSGNGQHLLGVKLQIGDVVIKKLGGLLGSRATEGILGKLASAGLAESFLENGKLTLHVESTGELTNPKVRIKNKLPESAENLIDNLMGDEDSNQDDSKEDSLKRAGKDLLKGFLK